MNKRLAKKVVLSLLTCSVMVTTNTAWCSDILDGDGNVLWKVFGGAGSNFLRAETNVDGIIPEADYSGMTFYGGMDNDNDVENNKITVNGGTITYIKVGDSMYGNAKNNILNISAGNFGYFVYGGITSYGEASDNEINITDGNFSAFIYCGRSHESVANNNEINILGGTFENIVYAGGGELGANDNQLNISGGSFEKDIAAGFADEGTVSGNVCNIFGGTFNKGVYGGAAYDAEAVGNTVNIAGGTFNGDIYGGFTRYGVAHGNTINISGNADLENANLYGMKTYNRKIYDASLKSDVLNIGYKNIAWNNHKLKAIEGFDVINFNNLVWNPDGVAVEVETFKLEPIDAQNNGGTTVVVNSIDKAVKPNQNEKMTLISSGNDLDENKLKGVGEINIGGFVKANGEISIEDNNINLLITKVGGNEQALVIGESRSAATAFTNQGSELVETGIDALARDNNKDTKVFAALYGNASEYATGSHVKVNGFSGIVGVGKTNTNGLTIGAFFENGEGNYRTYNVVDGDFMRGDGEANYNGGGLLVRKDNADGVYAEASLRAGNLQNELRNAVRGSEGLAGYDVDTLYYGAHVGIGKVIPRGNEGDSIDVYGKFIYTHHDNEDFTIDGDDFHFDSVNSERLRLGFRINEVQNDKLDMYYGVAWEYEFNGDANNTVVGYELATPSLEGSTVIGELGAHYKANEKWSFDLNARSYAGQRDGFSGSLQANYSF